MTEKKIENWTVLPGGGINSILWGRCPPDGKVFNPRLFGEDRPGHIIITSLIVKVDGRNVFTKSGSHYILGKTDMFSFGNLLKVHRLDYIESNPLIQLLDRMKVD